MLITILVIRVKLVTEKLHKTVLYNTVLNFSIPFAYHNPNS